MGELEFTFIGSGNAFAPGGLCQNGFLVDGRFLFETPPTALMALNTVGKDANDLDAVIISHHHGDHFLGLPFILLHWKYRGRMRPVTIVGPVGTEKLAHEIGEKVFPGVFDLRFAIDWVDATPGETLEFDGLTLLPVAVEHDDRLSMSLGYACALGGRRFAYTGDSRLCEAVLELARSAEVLVSECASLSDDVPIHMNLRDDIPRVREAMSPEATLLLTHVEAGLEVTGLPRTSIAKDFETYRF